MALRRPRRPRRPGARKSAGGSRPTATSRSRSTRPIARHAPCPALRPRPTVAWRALRPTVTSLPPSTRGVGSLRAARDVASQPAAAMTSLRVAGKGRVARAPRGGRNRFAQLRAVLLHDAAFRVSGALTQHGHFMHAGRSPALASLRRTRGATASSLLADAVPPERLRPASTRAPFAATRRSRVAHDGGRHAPSPRRAGESVGARARRRRGVTGRAGLRDARAFEPAVAAECALHRRRRGRRAHASMAETDPCGSCLPRGARDDSSDGRGERPNHRCDGPRNAAASRTNDGTHSVDAPPRAGARRRSRGPHAQRRSPWRRASPPFA